MAVKTVRTPTVGGAQVNANQHIHYFLHASGAKPVFNHACQHQDKPLLNERSFADHPKADYEWVLRRSAAEPVPGLGHDVLAIDMDADQDNDAVSMSYIAVDEYTLRVELHDQNHHNARMLSDIDYERDEVGDFVTFEIFR